MNMDPKDLAGFAEEMAKLQGVGVITVSDGWVMLFTKEKIEQMYEAVNDDKYLLVQVKSSEKMRIKDGN